MFSNVVISPIWKKKELVTPLQDDDTSLFFLYQHTSHISQCHLFPQITHLCRVHSMFFPRGVFDVMSRARWWRRSAVFTKQAANKQTFMQVLLAKHKADNKFYAVKVLQKKVILKKKEVPAVPACSHIYPDVMSGRSHDELLPSDIQCLHASQQSAAPG